MQNFSDIRQTLRPFQKNSWGGASIPPPLYRRRLSYARTRYHPWWRSMPYRRVITLWARWKAAGPRSRSPSNWRMGQEPSNAGWLSTAEERRWRVATPEAIRRPWVTQVTISSWRSPRWNGKLAWELTAAESYIHVRRAPLSAVSKTVKQPTKVMVWGVMSYRGLSDLHMFSWCHICFGPQENHANCGQISWK